MTSRYHISHQCEQNEKIRGEGESGWGNETGTSIYICHQDRCYLVIEMFQKSQLKSVSFIIERRVEVQ